MIAKLYVLSILVVLTVTYKESMLKENKTPKVLHARSTQFNGTCDECKMLVERFAEAIKDPQKLAELKDLLRLLCHHTSYEDECRVFVDQLDHFIDKLEPYLRDLICEECQFAAQELKHAIEDEKSQERLKRFISEEICSRLGSLQGKCDLVLEEFMPEFFEELDRLLQNTKTFCADFGLCERFIKPLAILEAHDNDPKPKKQRICKACQNALTELKVRLLDSHFQKTLENIVYQNFCQKLLYEISLFLRACKNMTDVDYRRRNPDEPSTFQIL